MKHVKKLASVLLAMVMVMAMTMTAFAEDGYTISVPAAAEGEVSHTYEVFQIFTGTLSESGTTLSNLVWGKNGTGETGTSVDNDTIAALAAAEGTDTEKLAVITQYANLKSEVYGTVVSGGTLTNVPAGYYLIKDKDNSLNGQDDAYTTYIVKVVNNVTVTPKSAKPTVDKAVYDNNDNVESGDNNGWKETADHAINESFQFKLTATLSADTDYAAYETYKVVFTDTMSAGITFESIESVTVDGVTLTSDQYTCTATEGQSGGSWTLTINVIKSIGNVNLTDGADIVVIYNAHLNDNASVNTATGTTDNKNTVKLQYSNNPNAGGDGELGETPEDHVWVFTYEIDNTKYKDAVSSNNVLAGAGFTLYDSSNNAVQLYLKDDVYYVYDADAVTGVDVITEMTSQANGTFNIKGLDVGTYTLKETSTPDGYNTCDPITIVITATHNENSDGSSATTTLTNSENMNNSIVNKSGSTLPETGGMGTTIFYVIGSILVLGAAVVMITRKRMAK